VRPVEHERFGAAAVSAGWWSGRMRKVRVVQSRRPCHNVEVMNERSTRPEILVLVT
jgi:hypothetical protein